MPPGDADLEPVDAIITRGQGRVTAELIARCPQLKVIGRCGVGLDNIDVEAATAAGVAVKRAQVARIEHGRDAHGDLRNCLRADINSYGSKHAAERLFRDAFFP